jgi:hypothetical protein
MSQEFQLVTRERPEEQVFLGAVRDAAGDGGGDVMLDGDFDDPNGYLSVVGYGLLIEIEPPGHVEAADLGEDACGEVSENALPEPDAEGCLWLTTAHVAAGAPAGSADVAWRVFTDLASRYDGVALPG